MPELNPLHIWQTLQAEGFEVKQDAASGAWAFRTPVGYSGSGYLTPEEAIDQALRLTIEAAKVQMGLKTK